MAGVPCYPVRSVVDILDTSLLAIEHPGDKGEGCDSKRLRRQIPRATRHLHREFASSAHYAPSTAKVTHQSMPKKTTHYSACQHKAAMNATVYQPLRSNQSMAENALLILLRLQMCSCT